MKFIKSFITPPTITLDNGKEVQAPNRWNLVIGVVFIILLFLSAQITNFNLRLLLGGAKEFISFLQRMIPPNWSYLPTIVEPMIQTFAMSFLGTLFAALFTLPVAYLASGNMNTNVATGTTVRFIMSVFRTIPVLIIALIMTYIFGLGTFAGMVAIFLFTFSILTKMTYEQIELVDMGPFEASLSAGTSRFEAFCVAIVPQISGLYLSSILYNLEMNIRSAAVLGYVGAGGIGTLMNQNIGWRQYQNLATLLVVLLISVLLIEFLSRLLRKRYLS